MARISEPFLIGFFLQHKTAVIQYHWFNIDIGFLQNGFRHLPDRYLHFNIQKLFHSLLPFLLVFWQDIYLAGYDTAAGSDSQYCILEFVVQPWKYAALAGLLLFLAGAVAMIRGGRQRV